MRRNDFARICTTGFRTRPKEGSCSTYTRSCNPQAFPTTISPEIETRRMLQLATSPLRDKPTTEFHLCLLSILEPLPAIEAQRIGKHIRSYSMSAFCQYHTHRPTENLNIELMVAKLCVNYDGTATIVTTFHRRKSTEESGDSIARLHLCMRQTRDVQGTFPSSSRLLRILRLLQLTLEQ